MEVPANRGPGARRPSGKGGNARQPGGQRQMVLIPAGRAVMWKACGLWRDRPHGILAPRTGSVAVSVAGVCLRNNNAHLGEVTLVACPTLGDSGLW